jgi:serine protease Do
LRKTILLAALAFAAPARGATGVISFADVAARAMPGVVNIRTTSYVAGKDAKLDLYQFFLRGMVPKSTSTHSLGSGVVIDKRGHIVTNHHVIQGASVVEVLFHKSKKKQRATVVGVDTKTDLALLKVSAEAGLAPVDLGDSDSLRVGDVVLAIGNPFGYGHTVTSGIISAKGRVIGTGPYDDFLQTDASIHPGNSGGPLLDFRGRVIGINTAVDSQGPGIGFAIPINLAKQITRDLLAHGKVRRPYLGVVGKNILSSDEFDASDKDGNVYGVIVQNLIVEGPGHKAGLRIGDLIMGFDASRVDDLNHLQRLMSSKEPADRVRLKVYRRGKGFSQLSVALDELPKATDLPIEKDLF